MTTLEEFANKFALEGKIKEITAITTGWINQTYQVITEGENTPDYILQRINHLIFKDVDLLQNNIYLATNHIRKKLQQEGVEDIERKVMRIIPTHEGKLYYYTGQEYWRMLYKIPNCKSYDQVDPHFAEKAGEAFGRFQCQLSDLDSSLLGETIPNFHNMESRLADFKKALGENIAGRAEKVSDLIEQIEKRSEEMCKAERLHREGKLPKRINHCDTKVNNMLFDQEGNVLCIIDLDTVMPGYVSSDFGDFMRSAGNCGAEDDPDLSKVEFNIEIFKSYTKGYLSTATFLLPIEKELLPFGAKLITYMQVVRFLTDYLNGDTYYKILHPEHNLQRTKAQMKLLQSMEKSESLMNQFIADYQA